MDVKKIKAALDSTAPEERDAMLKKLEGMAMGMGTPFDREKFLSAQDPHLRVRLESLYENQGKLDATLKEFAAERKALELKYRAICEPVYQERSKVLRGEVVPPGGEGQEKGIPGFWLECLIHHDELAESVTEKDMKVLHHLLDITCTFHDGDADEDDDEAEGHHGFKLVFTFEPNEFFEGTELRKSYLFQDEEQMHLMRSKGTDIEWKSGKDPTVKILKKKGKGGAPAKFKKEKIESFFNFFSPPAMPDDDDGMGEDEEESLQEALEMDYEMGANIKDLLPTALKWYTGEAEAEQGLMSFPDGDDDDDEDDDDDDDEDNTPKKKKNNDDDDDDDDDDESEDDEDDVPVNPPTDKKDPECKQQ